MCQLNTPQFTTNSVNSLRDDDLAYLMVMNTKELHKLCGKLKEDRFLAV